MKKSSKKKDIEIEDEVLNDAANEAENSETNPEEGKEAKLEQELGDLNEKYLRLYSEFDNYRRRTSREKLDLMKSASADLLTELLPVVDDFDRTVESFDKVNENSIEALLEGVKLVQNKFVGILNRQGLQFFDAMEQKFDPDFHEAITKIPAPSKKLRGKVVDVIEKGYMLNDKVLRYAKVVVGE